MRTLSEVQKRLSKTKRTRADWRRIDKTIKAIQREIYKEDWASFMPSTKSRQ